MIVQEVKGTSLLGAKIVQLRHSVTSHLTASGAGLAGICFKEVKDSCIYFEGETPQSLKLLVTIAM